MNHQGTKELDLDLLTLLKKIWSQKVLITFSALVLAFLAFFASNFIIKPKYTSTTRIYVVNKNSENVTAQDLQVGGYLVNDYKEIIKSREVLAEIVNTDGAGLTADELSGMIRVDVPAETRIISISVTNSDPKRAQQLANRVREVAATKIKTVTQVDDVTTLEEAQLPTVKSSPNVRRNVLLALVAGAFLAITAILIREVLDDRVKRPEDVEEVLGMTLLGIVPDSTKL